MAILQDKCDALTAAFKKKLNVKQAVAAVGGVSYYTAYHFAKNLEEQGKYKVASREGVRKNLSTPKRQALALLRKHPNATNVAKALKLPPSTVTGWAGAANITLKRGGDKTLSPLPKNIRPTRRNQKKTDPSLGR